MQHTRRRGFIMEILAFAGLVGAALTAHPAQAASGVGPYYAAPAWDQKIPADQRFLILTNWNSEAVLDKETGLVWERAPASTTHTWVDARSQCTSRTTGNRKGWRLPSVHELASLVRPGQFFPALPTGHPFTTVQTDSDLYFYWSATTNADNPALSSWDVHFANGFVDFENKASSLRAWCVRGGNNADAY